MHRKIATLYNFLPSKVVNLIYRLAAGFLYKVGVRFLDIHPLQLERIGHFSVDIDSYLKNHILAKIKVRPVVLLGDCKPNLGLLEHWSGYVYFVKNKWLSLILRPFLEFPHLTTRMLEYSMVGWQAWDETQPFAARRGASPIYSIQNRWKDRPPLLKLSATELRRGKIALRELGLPEGAWFVCVHARESTYLSPSTPGTPENDSSSFRNANILDYVEAMNVIIARGGWCIRVGDPTMQPINPIKGVIDYAHSPLKSDWMDLYLCASCRFFLGNTSGLACLPGVFGVPSALANFAPLSCAYSCYPDDLSILKLLADESGKPISWAAALNGELSELRRTEEFALHALNHIDNSPEEIACLANEMLDRIEGSITYSDIDVILQDKFRSLIKPYHYSWGAGSRIGADFLRRHQTLLD